MLPFTSEVFFSNFAAYNAAIWPAQIVAYALGAYIILLTFRPYSGSGRFIATSLAIAWVWMGVVYHWLYFAPINFTAWPFGLLFVIQGLLLAWTGTLRGRLEFRFRPNLYGWAGLSFVVFAMGVYPLVGYLLGHGWPRAPMFGVAPCPTTIFTLGMLLLMEGRVPVHLLVIPVLWSLIGAAAVWLLDVPEDFGLLLAGALAVFLIFRKNRALSLGESRSESAVS